MTANTIDAERLVATRRHLHRNPELSLEEHETARFIRDRLDELGIPWEIFAETGVVATIDGEHSGPTYGFRADIDALPIHETNDHAYVSENPGVMHACGHDVHTTIGLGIAETLWKRRSELHGSVRAIFQPAEEASPIDEPIGAERMAQEGAIDGVDAVFAFHVMPTLEVGKIGHTGGAVWAESTLVEIEIGGQKTHAAYPHEGIDAIVVAAQTVVALQTVASRRVDAREAIVLSIGHLEAGNSYNIIADAAKLTGILRTLNSDVTRFAKVEIQRIVEGTAAAHGATANVAFTDGARLTANDPELERRTVEQLRDILGPDAIVPHLPQLGAEDFAAFSSRVPGCYLFLGVRNEARGITHMIHTPKFDVDEACLPLAVEAMSEALLRLGAQHTH
jgi:amidohydrolase